MKEVAAQTGVAPAMPINGTFITTGKLIPSRQLSVLHVHSGNLFGGIERAILTCVENLDLAPSISFEFALCFTARFGDELATAKQIIHKLPEVRVRNPLSVLAARRELALVLARKQYDAVICHSPWGHSVFAPVIKCLGVPELFWAHDHFSGNHLLERWARRTSPDFVISNGGFSDGSVTRLFPRSSHQVLRYPVNTKGLQQPLVERNRVRAELNTPNDAVVIIQVSRMESWKGHDLLLEAAAKMRREFPWMIWFIGGAQRKEEEVYLASLKDKARRLGITDRVRFAGERTDVPRLLAAADIFCQPNRAPEPFGIVFVEALSHGLPVITFAMGGPAEIVDETCGILIVPGNQQQFADELKRLIHDKELRRKLGQAGPARAKALCDPAVILPQLEKLLSQLSASRISYAPFFFTAPGRPPS